MRKYTSLDLVKFLDFANRSENKELKPFEIVKKYNEEYPELSAKEKLINLSKALNINSLHKAVTGKDIDPNDELYRAWNGPEKEAK